jgi:hypothetical protein
MRDAANETVVGVRDVDDDRLLVWETAARDPDGNVGWPSVRHRGWHRGMLTRQGLLVWRRDLSRWRGRRGGRGG